MRSAILGTVLTVTAALATTAPAQARTAAAPVRPGSASAVLVASCTATVNGTFTSPLDPGSSNAPQAESLTQTGTATCVDDAGEPLIRGTVTRTVVLPAAQCSGIAYSDPATTTFTWADGTTSAFSLSPAAVVTVLGTASSTGTGAVTAASTKFAGDSIDGAVMSTGPGCGTASGQTAVSSTIVFTLAR
jgi:hypothetical protein